MDRQDTEAGCRPWRLSRAGRAWALACWLGCASGAAEADAIVSSQAVGDAIDFGPAEDRSCQHPEAGTALTAGPISLDFQRIDIRALLQVFAHFTGLNLLTSDSVQGDVTVRLKDVPWQLAFDIVLESKGLGSHRVGNVLWVAPLAELEARRRRELESRQQLAELEPLRWEAFELNYQRAEDVRRMLLGQDGAAASAAWSPEPRSPGTASGTAPRLLSRRGTLTTDPRTNQLFVSDIAERLDAIHALLARIDVPVRQVVIEARIVEADDKFSRDLGVRLGLAAQSGGKRVGSGYDSALPGADAGTPMLDFPASGRTGVAPATAAIGLFDRAASRLLALELSALESEGRGRIVSSPRVITANHIKALIEQGTELPYQAATSSGATSVQFRKANLKLEVTPQITPEGNVLLDVDVNKDSVGTQTAQGYAIDTKHVQTQVLVDNGGTVVMGGIYTQTERRDDDKVPLLGDLPVVGALFRNRATLRDRTELLVFLTPRVLQGDVPASRGDRGPMQ
ncbi:type IV pilus assembly protein PilQ [Cupriavidus gilardii J11]|uniref:Type IV pilus biogenesis and competence protein PilQ n=1 Tax=Cupriavidus gilardii J11 TaxID=936133 RepID=A0A562BE67_9BURK|nr:type IV pilus assembly protein PilQ [Cupriavidus gilardii J11]